MSLFTTAGFDLMQCCLPQWVAVLDPHLEPSLCSYTCTYAWETVSFDGVF